MVCPAEASKASIPSPMVCPPINAAGSSIPRNAAMKDSAPMVKALYLLNGMHMENTTTNPAIVSRIVIMGLTLTSFTTGT